MVSKQCNINSQVPALRSVGLAWKQQESCGYVSSAQATELLCFHLFMERVFSFLVAGMFFNTSQDLKALYPFIFPSSPAD